MKLAIMATVGITVGIIALMSGTAAADHVHLTASASHVRHCGSSQDSSHPWGDLRATHIGCHGARNVANRYSPSHPNPLGFHCKSHSSSSGEGNHLACTRTRRGKRQLVVFLYGV